VDEYILCLWMCVLVYGHVENYLGDGGIQTLKNCSKVSLEVYGQMSSCLHRKYLFFFSFLNDFLLLKIEVTHIHIPW
jgi:hypothetical protein